MATTKNDYIPIEEIHDTSPLSIKMINDNFRYIAMKIMGGLNSYDIPELDANITTFKNLTVEQLITKVLVTQTLYAQYGFIADLTVNRLCTATFVQKYLASFVSTAGDLTFGTDSITSKAGAFSGIVAGDKLSISGCTANIGNNKEVTVLTASESLITVAAGTFTAGQETGQITVKVITDVNYQRIQGEVQEFVTASTDGSATTQLVDMNGSPVYWVDSTHNTGITFDVTDYPVTIWVYTELIKRRKYFMTVNGEYVPVDELGAGAGVEGHPDWGKGYIYKLSDGMYFKYLKRTDGSEVLIKLTDDGLNLDGVTKIIYNEGATIDGQIQIWVQDTEPTNAKEKDLWLKTNGWSRYETTTITEAVTLAVSDNEVIFALGTFIINLHTATALGIIKKIYNCGSGIITIAGTVNGETNMYLYPEESVELITDGSGWRC